MAEELGAQTEESGAIPKPPPAGSGAVVRPLHPETGLESGPEAGPARPSQDGPDRGYWVLGAAIAFILLGLMVQTGRARSFAQELETVGQRLDVAQAELAETRAALAAEQALVRAHEGRLGEVQGALGELSVMISERLGALDGLVRSEVSVDAAEPAASAPAAD